tara:strand:- start:9055 stop:11535 length:2481 start_codon:yes stop_codon:yes gene_type:complete
MAKQTNSIAPDAGNIDVSTKSIAQMEKQLRQIISVLKKTSVATGGVDGSLAKLNAELKKESAALGMTNTQVNKLAKSMGVLEVRNNRNGMALSVFRSKLLMFSFTAGLAAKFTTDLVKAFSEQERAEQQVTNALISTNHASGQTTQSIIAMSAALQDQTGIADEAILSSSALLATFTSIGGEVFPQAQQAILDVTAAMYQGNVTSEALKTTTIQVGKALNDPIKGMSALGRVGIQFTAQQKKQIRMHANAGRTQKAQAIILKELNVQFKDSASNIAESTKSFMLFNDAVSDFRQRIGGNLEGTITGIANALTKMMNAMDVTHLLNFVAVTGTAATAMKLYNASMLKTVVTGAIFKGSFKSLGKVLTFAKAKTLALAAANRILASSTGIGAAAIAIGALITGLMGWTGIIKSAKEEQEEGNTVIGKTVEQLEAEKTAVIATRDANDLSKVSLEKLREEYEASQTAYLGFIKARVSNATIEASANEQYAKSLKDIERLEKAIIDRKKKDKDDKDSGEDSPEAKRTEQISKLITKYEGLADKTAGYNKLQKHSILGTKRLSEEDRLLFEIATKLQYVTDENGTAIEKLIGEKGGGIPELIRQTREYSKELEIQIERKKQVQAFDKLQSELTSLASAQLSNHIDSLNAEKDADIAAMKETSAYKLAQKRGDNVKMEALEKEAAKKSFARRKAAFRANQLLAVSNIVIDYLQGIAKETSKTGLFGLTTSGVIMTAASLAAVGTIMSQKPPAFAKGGDFVTSGPQMIQVGDNPGGRERVSVTPLSSPNFEGPQGGSVNISFSGNVMSQDFIEDEAIPMIKEAIRRGADIGVA